jgi:hypothetical protein
MLGSASEQNLSQKVIKKKLEVAFTTLKAAK